MEGFIKAWKSFMYGFISILFITPLLGLLMVHFPLNPSTFATGLAIMCVTPTSVNSANSIIIQCRGNTTISLSLTVITNALGVVIMPITLKMLQSTTGSIHFSEVFLAKKIGFHNFSSIVFWKSK